VSVVLGIDTATPATVVGLARDGHEPRERRHDPAPGERPAHASKLLELAAALLAEAGLSWRDVERIGVGVGPGTFTGLRIGVATARALAQAAGAETVAVSTLEALASAAAGDAAGRPVAAILDARRGEAFAAGWRDGDRLFAPVAAAPEALPAILGEARESGTSEWVAVGDGAVRFRGQLEPAAVVVPVDGSPLHRVSALAICRLALRGPSVDLEALVPEYVRAPDAVEKARRTAP
jgi:tRNA threonylcarbamoyladenosine biosynthesis protein TsaB